MNQRALLPYAQEPRHGKRLSRTIPMRRGAVHHYERSSKHKLEFTRSKIYNNLIY